MARLSDKQGGFTLIEVSTALIFVGFIIFILAATTVNIVRSYNKGIWLAQINQAGQQMNNDIGDKARYSPAATVDTVNRRMCINGVSYLWNTQKDIDNDPGNNRYSDGTGTPIRLARIDDPKGEYCLDLKKRPGLPSTNSEVHILLGRGATIQEFKVEEQKAGAPLLTISVVVSTEGANRPYKVSLDKSGKYKEDMTNGTWQCGDFIDDHPSNGKLDEGEFTPAKNQYCSFAKYTFTVYERSKI